MSDESRLQLNVTANTDGLDRGLASAGKKLSDFDAKAKKVGESVGSMGYGAEVSGKKMDRATQNMINAIKRTTLAVETGGDALKKFERQAELRGISKDALRPYLNQLREAKERAEEAKKATDGWSASLGPLKTSLGTLLAGVSFGAATAKLIEVQREFDRLNSSLITVSGSSAQAEAEMAWLKEFAKTTPYGLAQATEAFVKMKALGLNPTREAMTSFGNTASAMGKDLMQFVEAVADATSGEFERLKEFGITASKEGDKVALTFQGVTKTIGNSAEEITKYLDDIGNNQFAGAMEERAKTLDGAIAGLGDSWDELWRTISAAGVGDAIAQSTRIAASALDELSAVLALVDSHQRQAAEGSSLFETNLFSMSNAVGNLSLVAIEAKYAVEGVGRTIGALGAAAYASIDGLEAARAVLREFDADSRQAAASIDDLRHKMAGLMATRQNASGPLATMFSGSLDAYMSGALARDAASAPKAPRASGGGSSSKKGSGKRATAAKDEFKDLFDSLFSRTAQGQAEDFFKKLDLLRTGMEAGKITAQQYVLAVEQLSTSHEHAKATSQALAEAQKAINEQIDEDRRARLELIEAEEKRSDQYALETEQMREELKAMGLTEDQLYELADARLAEQIAAEEARLAADDGAEMMSREREAIKRNIQVLKERRDVIGQRREIERAIEANEQFAASLASINEAFRNAFVESTGDIKDIFSDLWKSALAGFKDLVYQMTIQPILINIGASLTGTTGSQFASMMGVGGGGAGGMLGNLSSIGSLVSGIGTFGGGLAAGWGGLMGSLGLGGTGATLGGALSAGTTAMSMGNIAGGLGTFAGALGPIALGLGAVFSLISSLDGSGDPHSGAFASYSAANGLRTDKDPELLGMGTGWGPRDYNSDIAPGVNDLARAIAVSLDGFSRSFGGSGGYEVTTGWADDFDGEGASWGGLRIAQDGQTVVDWTEGPWDSKWSPREFSAQEEGYEEYLNAVAQEMRAVLLDMDLPSWAESMLEGLGDSATVEQLAQTMEQIGQIEAMFQSLGQTLSMFADLTDEVESALLEAAGGIDALASSVNDFYQGFYSEEERRAALIAQISARLSDLGFSDFDLAASDAREQFRALVEAQMALGAEAAPTAAALLGLSSAVASVTTTAAEAAAAQEASAAAQRQAALAAAKLSVDSLVSGFITEVDEGRGAQAGEWLADAIAAGFENAIYGQAVSIIMNSIVDGVITPVVTAALAGSSVAEAVSEAAIESMVANATAAAEALNAMLSDDAFNTAIAGVLDVVRGLGNSLGGAMRGTSRAIATTAAAAEAAARAFEELKQQLEDAYAAAMNRTDGEFDAYQRNQQKEIDRWQGIAEAAADVRNEAQGLFDLLHRNVLDLYGDVESTAAMQARKGQAFIDAAIATLRAGGGLPDQDALAEAIDATRDQLVADNFSSGAEYAAAQLRLAAQLAELEDAASNELSVAEQQATLAEGQIKLLQDEIDLFQQQIDEIRRNGEYLGTIASLTQAIRDEQLAKAAVASVTGSTGGLTGGLTGGAGTGNGLTSDGLSFKPATGTDSFGDKASAEARVREINAAGGTAYMRQLGGGWQVLNIGSGFSESRAIQELKSVIQSGAGGDAFLAASIGHKVTNVASAFGAAPDDMEAWLKEQGYQVIGGVLHKKPAFDVGAMNIPYDMEARLHAKEIVVPAFDSEWLRRKADGMSAVQAEKLINAVEELAMAMGRGTLISNRQAELLEGIRDGIEDLTA